MATVPSEITWTTGQVVTAAQLNSNLRDAVNFIISPPLFVGRQTVTQSIANTTWTVVTWDTEDIDRDNGHSTVTNTSRYTAQTTGWYEISANVDWAASATGDRAISWTINGANRAGKVQLGATPSFDTAIHTAGVVFLNANDYVEIGVWQNSGGALSTGLTDGNPRVSVRWVST